MITRALQRFERVKRAYSEKSQAYQFLSQAYRQDSVALVGKNHIIDWYKVAYGEEQSLRQDADKKRVVAQNKATRRGFLVALETIGLAAAGYFIITH